MSGLDVFGGIRFVPLASIVIYSWQHSSFPGSENNFQFLFNRDSPQLNVFAGGMPAPGNGNGRLPFQVFATGSIIDAPTPRVGTPGTDGVQGCGFPFHPGKDRARVRSKIPFARVAEEIHTPFFG